MTNISNSKFSYIYYQYVADLDLTHSPVAGSSCLLIGWSYLVLWMFIGNPFALFLEATRQTVDLALFNNQMHFSNNFLHFTLRESSIISCEDLLYFKRHMTIGNWRPRSSLFSVVFIEIIVIHYILIRLDDLNRCKIRWQWLLYVGSFF